MYCIDSNAIQKERFFVVELAKITMRGQITIPVLIPAYLNSGTENT